MMITFVKIATNIPLSLNRDKSPSNINLPKLMTFLKLSVEVVGIKWACLFAQPVCAQHRQATILMHTIIHIILLPKCQPLHQARDFIA